MRNRFNSSGTDSVSGIAFRDILLAAMAFMAAAVLILLILPTLKEEKDKEQDESLPPKGNLIAEVSWDDDRNVDIDLWSKAPGLHPVGFSNMQGPVLNLLRDDLGSANDISNKNYELTFSRGIPPGKWTYAVKYFSSHGESRSKTDPLRKGKPIPIEVEFVLRKQRLSPSGRVIGVDVVFTRTITLYNTGDEITLVNFEVDDEGDVIKGSVDILFNPIAVNGGVHE